MKRDHVDIFILHEYVIPDGWQGAVTPRAVSRFGVEWSSYRDRVIPTFEKLESIGRIGAWGITAAGPQEANLRAVAEEMDIEPAVLAHRYALSMDGVETVVLGAKNRSELAQCLEAESAPALDAPSMHRIDETVSGIG